jgi:hypothetical protein
MWPGILCDCLRFANRSTACGGSESATPSIKHRLPYESRKFRVSTVAARVFQSGAVTVAFLLHFINFPSPFVHCRLLGRHPSHSGPNNSASRAVGRQSGVPLEFPIRRPAAVITSVLSLCFTKDCALKKRARIRFTTCGTNKVVEGTAVRLLVLLESADDTLEISESCSFLAWVSGCVLPSTEGRRKNVRYTASGRFC